MNACGARVQVAVELFIPITITETKRNEMLMTERFYVIVHLSSWVARGIVCVSWYQCSRHLKSCSTRQRKCLSVAGPRCAQPWWRRGWGWWFRVRGSMFGEPERSVVYCKQIFRCQWWTVVSVISI